MAQRTLTVEYVPLVDVKFARRNPKLHDLPSIRASFDRFGLGDAAGIIDGKTGRLVAGHGRITVLREMLADGAKPPPGVLLDDDGVWTVPLLSGVRWKNQAEAEAFLLAHNRTTELGGWDRPALAEMVDDVERSPLGLSGTGFVRDDDPDDDPGLDPAAARSLADRFVVPPFSVLDARQGYWLSRKRAWLSLGLRSEEGRPENDDDGSPNGSVPAGHLADPAFFSKKRAAEAKLGRELTVDEFVRDHWDGKVLPGTSVFDPVLCEVAYRWFSPEGGLVLDPFAGGSVRGIVAGWLGRRYYGVDLSGRQIAANEEQAASILGRKAAAGIEYGDDDLRVSGPDGVDLVFSCPPLYLREMAAEALVELSEGFEAPEWRQGDSSEALAASDADAPDDADLLFSCPPYFDLEVYSDDPADLSAATSYEAFLRGYRSVISAACARLADDRFAVWVVGDVRDRRGRLRNLVGDTIEAFLDAGLSYHNDAVLVTSLGSLPARSARVIEASRRLARGHQSVLVFCKGDAKKAAKACGHIEVPDPAEMFGEPLT